MNQIFLMEWDSRLMHLNTYLVSTINFHQGHTHYDFKIWFGRIFFSSWHQSAIEITLKAIFSKNPALYILPDHDFRKWKKEHEESKCENHKEEIRPSTTEIMKIIPIKSMDEFKEIEDQLQNDILYENSMVIFCYVSLNSRISCLKYYIVFCYMF